MLTILRRAAAAAALSALALVAQAQTDRYGGRLSETPGQEVLTDRGVKVYPETYRPPLKLRPINKPEQECFNQVKSGLGPPDQGPAAWTTADGRSLCAGAVNPGALAGCFVAEAPKWPDPTVAVEACVAGALRVSRVAFPETYCSAYDTLRNECPPYFPPYAPVYAEPTAEERQCANLVRYNWPVAARDGHGAAEHYRHDIAVMCADVVNAFDTFECFGGVYAQTVDDDPDQRLAFALRRCSADMRAYFQDDVPPPETGVEKCFAGAQCVFQAVFSKLSLAVPGCDGASICQAIMDQDAGTLQSWATGGGQCGVATVDVKGFLIETLGCVAEFGVREATGHAGGSFRFAEICAVSPDQFAKTVASAITCGAVHVRDLAGAAGCPPGFQTLGPDFIDRLKRLIFVPDTPKCIGCAQPGFHPPQDPWAQIAERHDERPSCYSPCPDGYSEEPWKPSLCRSDNGAKPVVRRSTDAIIIAKDACPPGWFKGRRLFSEESFCLSKCNGVSVGDVCFGTKVEPAVVRAALGAARDGE